MKIHFERFLRTSPQARRGRALFRALIRFGNLLCHSDSWGKPVPRAFLGAA
jgi:hypothetical protein